MNDEQFSSPNVDGTGHRWHPQSGDLVRDRESDCYGVVLEVRQTADAPAYVHVALTDGRDRWTIVELAAEQLERDTRGDVTSPSFHELEPSIEEAALTVLDAVNEIAPYRARFRDDLELVAALEAEAQRARVLVAAYGDRRRYDLAQREGQHAERLRVLCVAVRTIAERAVKL